MSSISAKLAVIISIVLMITAGLTVTANQSAASGYIDIYTLDDLNNIRNNQAGNYRLMNDINASITATWNSGAGWLPIPGFTGTLDGQGYNVTGLTINRQTTTKIGLFDVVNSGLITNINLRDADIKARGIIGGIIGEKQTSGTVQLTNVGFSGSINGVSGYHNNGGLIGNVAGGIVTITNSWTNVNLIAPGSSVAAGGFIGQVTSTAGIQVNIIDSTAFGTISGSRLIGGFIGYALMPITIINSQTDVRITGSSGELGGMIGSASSTVLITGSYAYGDITAASTFNGGLIGIAGSSAGSITINDSHARLNINTMGANNFNGGLIGRSDKVFAISNSSYVGSIYSTGSYLGGIIARYETSSTTSYITDSYAIVNIKGSTYLGGILGSSVNNVEISRSWSSGNINSISSTASRIGGIVGEGTATIVNSWSNVDITDHINPSGVTFAGGLAGNLFSASSTINSYATGKVHGDGNIGGLIGTIVNNCNIINSYATGDVVGQTLKGGLIGSIGTGNTITNCYYAESTGQTTSAGPEQQLTAYELKQPESFIGWDFVNVWAIEPNATYPYLKWTIGYEAPDLPAWPGYEVIVTPPQPEPEPDTRLDEALAALADLLGRPAPEFDIDLDMDQLINIAIAALVAVVIFAYACMRLPYPAAILLAVAIMAVLVALEVTDNSVIQPILDAVRSRGGA